jgi:hypothetical protein
VEFNQMMTPIALVSVLPEEQMMQADSSIDEVSKYIHCTDGLLVFISVYRFVFF